MRLLDGPPPAAGPERLASHNQRLGHLSAVRRRPELIPLLEASGLRGRGGAAFPVGRKWRTVAERRSRGAVVLANGAEGEPLSLKDRVLMAARPHLVLDGALLAADAVGADDMVLYVGHEHRGARAALEAALRERPEEARRVRVVEAPPGFVSGEETAAVHYLNAGRALPTSIPPRPFERGVGGRATLVQNVESLAVAGLLARGGTAGAGLITLSNGVAVPGVCEIDLGMTVGEAAALGGGLTGPQQAVLLGGHFGAWVGIEEAWALPLEVGALRAAGLGFGVLGTGDDDPGEDTSVTIDNADRLTLVPVTLAKGLEFDSVILVEPSRIANGEAYGLRRLYVALTRAVSRLTVIHVEPLPAELSLHTIGTRPVSSRDAGPSGPRPRWG